MSTRSQKPLSSAGVPLHQLGKSQTTCWARDRLARTLQVGLQRSLCVVAAQDQLEGELAHVEALHFGSAPVSRRVAALENALQATLFDRAAGGPRPTDLAKELHTNAERVEAEVLGLLDQASARRGVIAGRVRLALTESFAVHVIIPHVLKG